MSRSALQPREQRLFDRGICIVCRRARAVRYGECAVCWERGIAQATVADLPRQERRRPTREVAR